MAEFLAGLRDEYPKYHNAPVASFGDPQARLLIVGLAPGMHGANATGRPFTGDYAGILLYKALHQCGLASSSISEHARDGLTLRNCRITNAVKCLPPANKPTTAEADTCNSYLKMELRSLDDDAVVLALGVIAHRSVIRASEQPLSRYKFSHGAQHSMPSGLTVFNSYHCSRYNTQTRRLTEAMFIQVLERAAATASRLE